MVMPTQKICDISVASTGPPPRGGGNDRNEDFAETIRVASTGPPPRGGGNRSAEMTTAPVKPGFNGAAPARGRKFSFVEMRRCLQA